MQVLPDTRGYVILGRQAGKTAAQQAMLQYIRKVYGQQAPVSASCPVCRHAPCRCTRAARTASPPPGWGNRGMAGFDGRGGLRGAEPLADAAGEIPDVFGTVRGYRWWTLVAPPLHESPARADEVWPHVLLRGMQAHWEPGENIAECQAGYRYHDDAEIPHPACACGFWAYWRLQRHDGAGGHALPVCGVIEGYGAVLIGERGFRAARARIVALHLPFKIQPEGEEDDDPLGLGLPPRQMPPNPAAGVAAIPPSRLYPAGQQPNGAPAPWWQHPRFTGKVIGYGTGRPDPSPPPPSPPPPPELTEAGAEARQAARDKAEAWMAVIGNRLEQLYSGVRVFETRAAMEAVYPPDPAYDPAEPRFPGVP